MSLPASAIFASTSASAAASWKRASGIGDGQAVWGRTLRRSAAIMAMEGARWTGPRNHGPGTPTSLCARAVPAKMLLAPRSEGRERLGQRPYHRQTAPAREQEESAGVGVVLVPGLAEALDEDLQDALALAGQPVEGEAGLGGAALARSHPHEAPAHVQPLAELEPARELDAQGHGRPDVEPLLEAG